MRTVILTLCALLLAGVASSENLAVTTGDITAITDGRGNARILFRLAGLDGLADVAISRALLRVPVVAGASSREVTLLIHPMTRSWSAGAGWSDGWATPGGDFDRQLVSRVEVDLGATTTDLVFDVTTIAKEIVEHGAANEGFVLTAREGDALATTDVPLLQGLGLATLDVRYRRIPANADEVRLATRRARATAEISEDH